jgi:LPXTG-motif cell wall-anchored protein
MTRRTPVRGSGRGENVTVRVRSIAFTVGIALAAALLFASPALAASVTVGDNFYSPQTITISAGQSVTWTYPSSGSSIHSVTADDGSFNSSPGCPGNVNACMGPGDTYRHTFSSAGTFPYHCLVHGFAMSGTVVVQAGGGGTGPGNSGPLPNTGPSGATPLLFGLGLGLLVGGLALAFALRRRRA